MHKQNNYSIPNAVDEYNISRSASPTEAWNITHDESNILKGMALIMMFCHHVFFTARGYLTIPDMPDYLLSFGHWCNICVAIFAFLTGWVYAKGKAKSLTYPLRKGIQVYCSFLLAFSFLSVLALLFCHWRPGFSDILDELFPMGKINLMVFCWYAVIYPLILLILSVCDTLQRHLPFFAKKLSALIICTILFISARQQALGGTAIWLPVPVIAYYLSCSKSVSDFLHFCSRRSSYIIILYATAALALLYLVEYTAPRIVFHITSPQIVRSLSFIWGEGFKTGLIDSVYIITFMILIHRLRRHAIRRILAFIGILSMNMWFLHCVFFAPITRDVFQPIITYIPHPLFTLTVLLILCIPPAIMLQKIQHYLIKKIFSQ